MWGRAAYGTRPQATASFVDAASRFGITTVGTLLAVPADLEVAEDLLKNDELPIRMVVEALGPNVEARKALETYAREGKSPNVDRLRIGPPTYPLDGSMLSGRAALFQAYADAPWTSGALSMAPGTFQDLVKGWASGKEGVVLDASGSLAVHMVIDASERSREADPSPVPGQARPLLRVDGVDLVEGDDRSRLALLAKSGWVVSLQPTRLPYRAYMAHAIGEERMKEALPYRSLVDAGVTVAINSNWPMSAQTFQPTQILKWAVSGGEGRSQEALSMEQALKAYTAGAAGALGLSDRLGSIEVGKQADLVVLDRNPLEMASSPELLPGVPVRMTIASGTVVFEERKTAAGPAPEKAAVAMAGKRPASSSVPPPPASRD